jgi:3-carboxy-cis,cis-muconate lactonizing enzyme.
MPKALARQLIFCIPLLALVNAACGRIPSSYPPEHYLLITHPALNRITIIDLSTNKLVGALPTHKLPHDMLISRDRVLYVVNSGSQCISTYDLKSPEFWNYARNFMNQDSANLYASRTPSANMMGQGQANSSKGGSGDTAAWTTLNRDPVQSLPATFAHTYLTDTLFPEVARSMHEKVNAFSHKACYDCHDRSVGGRPFGPAFTSDSSAIVLVHLRGRNITFLNSRTLSIQRQIPLPIPAQYSPIEAWIAPDQSSCFVTCRNEIGESKPGLILVVDLRDGKLLKTITAGIYPWHLLADPTSTRLYINNFQSSRISIVDVAKRAIVDSLVVQNGPAMMALLPERNLLVVSCFYTDRVLVIDLATKKVEKTVEVDSNPTSLDFSSDGKILYVLCGGESSLNIIDFASGTVREKHKMLFGAYAFHPVDNRQSRQ